MSRTQQGDKHTPYTLGRLLLELEGAKRFFRPDTKTMPGINQLTLLCDRAFNGTGLTIPNVRQVRADLCHQLSCSLEIANELSLPGVVNLLEGREPSALPTSIKAEDLRAYPFVTLDHLLIMPGNSPIPIYPASCRIIPGDAPSVCPDASPPLPREYLPHVEKVFREFQQIPEGCTIHWIGHEAWKRNLCHCGPEPEAAAREPSDRQRDILQALFKQNAFDIDHRMTTADVTEAVEGKGRGHAETFKRPIADLTKRGLVNTAAAFG